MELQTCKSPSHKATNIYLLKSALKKISREFTEIASRKQSEALNSCEKAVKAKDVSVN